MTTPETSGKAGVQLDEAELFLRQQRFVADNRPAPGPLIIAIGMRTPENMGSILRHADAAGCPGVLFVDVEQPPAAKKLSRIARSADQHVQFSFLSTAELLSRIDTLPPLVAVEITSRSTDIFHTPLPAACSLVVGSERSGIPRSVLDRCSLAVHIPMYGINGSMNLSHALTLAMFEWRRQHS